MDKIHFDKKRSGWILPVVLVLLGGLIAWVIVFFVTLRDLTESLTVPNEWRGILSPSVIAMAGNTAQAEEMVHLNSASTKTSHDLKGGQETRTTAGSDHQGALWEYLSASGKYLGGKDCPFVTTLYDSVYSANVLTADLRDLLRYYARSPRHSRTRQLTETRLANYALEAVPTAVDIRTLLPYGLKFPTGIRLIDDLMRAHDRDHLAYLEPILMSNGVLSGELNVLYTPEAIAHAESIAIESTHRTIDMLERRGEPIFRFVSYFGDIRRTVEGMRSGPVKERLEKRVSDWLLQKLATGEMDPRSVYTLSPNDSEAEHISANMLDQEALAHIPDIATLDLAGTRDIWASVKGTRDTWASVKSGGDLDRTLSARYESLLREAIMSVVTDKELGVLLNDHQVFIDKNPSLHAIVVAKVDSFLLPCPE